MNKRIIIAFGLFIFFFLPVAQEGLFAKGHFSKNDFFMPPPPGDTIILDTVSIVAGEIVTRCLDTTNLTGPVDTMYNACPNNGLGPVTFAIIGQTRCVKYQGLSCGTDTACIVMCDTFGVCDTTTLIVTAFDPNCLPSKSYYYDTIFVNTSRDVSIDLSELSGNPISMINDCPGSSGNEIIFTLDDLNYRVNYTAVEVGTDTACIVVTDDRGFSDSTCVIITGKVPQTEIICDTIEINTSKVYCPDLDELDGQVSSIENICPQNSGNNVVFTVNSVTLCINAEGIELGTDSACIILCNNEDVCDTTIYKITVVPSSDSMLPPPIAVNETVKTNENESIGINVLGNDTIPGGPISLDILENPLHGFVNVNVDFTITYIPNNDFCGQDSFVYEVCNDVGCDTATVFVEVMCASDTFTIYNGFSPDGDGENDTFVINGIEDYPDNLVRVYNRWGNLVFEKKGYRGTWDGTWEGKDLPDGTYYYLIDLGDGKLFSGFLQINR
ncbi:MAG: gliding motility-associated C-terminal domain-containing protein [Saprospiraceae bacterium]